MHSGFCKGCCAIYYYDWNIDEHFLCHYFFYRNIIIPYSIFASCNAIISVNLARDTYAYADQIAPALVWKPLEKSQCFLTDVV